MGTARGEFSPVAERRKRRKSPVVSPPPARRKGRRDRRLRFRARSYSCRRHGCTIGLVRVDPFNVALLLFNLLM